MPNDLPSAIPGTKTAIHEHLTLSIRIDRTLVFEIGKSVLVIFSPEETSQVVSYMLHHARKFALPGNKESDT
jgi:hypothetical protein